MRNTVLVGCLAALLVSSSSPALAQGSQPSAPKLDFSGWIFGNLQYRTDSAAKAGLGGSRPSRFDIERVYLTFRMPAGERASVRVTTDVFQNAAAGYYGGWSVRLKYGYLQYNFTNALAGVKDLALLGRVGMLHTVLIDHQETFWPRWISPVATERNGFFSSADVGVASQLTLPNRAGEVYMTVVNGNGYAAPETDRFKDVATRFSWTPLAADTSAGLLRSLTVSPWFSKGWTASAAPATYTQGLRRDRYGLFAGLRDRRLTSGVELARRVETLETLTPTRATADRTGQLISLFAIARPAELLEAGRRSRFGVVARFDRFTPNTGSAANNRFVILGATWDLTDRASLALDYQAQTYASYATPPAEQRSIFVHWQTTF